MCSNKHNHESRAQEEVATEEKPPISSKIRRTRRKRKMQITKVRLGAAKGASKAAAAAADAVDDESSASVGPTRGASSSKRL